MQCHRHHPCYGTRSVLECYKVVPATVVSATRLSACLLAFVQNNSLQQSNSYRLLTLLRCSGCAGQKAWIVLNFANIQ